MSNRITITGNLTAAPELRFTGSGKAVASFTIADTPRRYNRDTQQWEDVGETLFLRCSAWERLGETAAETLTKGTRVTATGVLKQRSYETDAGEKRTVTEATIQEIATPINASQSGPQPGHSGGAITTGPADPWATDGGGSNDNPPF